MTRVARVGKLTPLAHDRNTPSDSLAVDGDEFLAVQSAQVWQYASSILRPAADVR
jgi:hypothetical protein